MIKKIILFGVCSLLLSVPQCWAAKDDSLTLPGDGGNPPYITTPECTGSNSSDCGKNDAGCLWVDEDKACYACPEGHYCPNTSLKGNCPLAYPKSAAGSKEMTDCYRKCDNKPEFLNGTWAPDDEKLYYDPAHPSSGECTYAKQKITCNNSDSCGGYHVNCTGGDNSLDCECVLNWNEGCAETTRPKGYKNGFDVWDTKNSNWKCIVTECESGYAVVIDNNTTPNSCTKGEITTTCVLTEQAPKCSSASPLQQNCSKGIIGTITGTYKYILKSDNNKWTAEPDYSGCYCEKTGIQIEHGRISSKCAYIGGDDTWGNCQSEITACDAGYCSKSVNDPKCEVADDGYYSPDGAPDCQQCPFGMTTYIEKKDITNCFSRGLSSVEFRDNAGKLELPNRNHHEYYINTYPESQ